MKRKILILVGFILWFKLGFTQIPAVLEASFDSIVSNSLPSVMANSGVVVGVYVPGQWSWTTALGNSISGLTLGYPAEAAMIDSRYRVGSISKMFIATSILQLEELGLLNIEDDISNYLRSSLVNDTIQNANTITIRNLLDHTSGIADLATNDSCRTSAFLDLTRKFSLEESIFCGCIQGKMFPPNYSWGYSNTNYSILSMIIEQVTGISSYDYIKTNIITPLGLLNTEIPITDQIDSSHMGCYWDFPPLLDLTIVDASLYQGWADIVSTTHDLYLFFDALRNGTLISHSSYSKMMSVSSSSYDYGLGIDFYAIDGDSYYGHSGEVGNTSGLFFADISTDSFPKGYYLSYNYNYQGVSASSLLEEPLHALMKNYSLQDTAINIDTNLLTQESLDPLLEFEVSPNPSSGDFYITTNDFSSSIIEELAIYDLNGSLLKTLNSFSTNESILVSNHNFSKGIYQIRMVTQHGVVLKKVVIE